MNSTAQVARDLFQQLLVDAFGSAGVDVGDDVDPLGCEFEAEGRLARVIPCRDPGLALIEVEVQPLADVPPGRAHQLAWELMKLNHEARFEHAWTVVIDDDDVLSITTTVPIRAMNGDALAETLFDGVERAAQLGAVAEGLLAALGGSAQPQAPQWSHHLLA